MDRSTKAIALVTFLFVVFLGACGSTAGASCDKDSDCSDMKCLHDKIAGAPASTCVDQPGKGTCSLACTTNAQCATYGSTFKCALSAIDTPCNPTGVCRDNYTCNGPSCRLAPDK